MSTTIRTKVSYKSPYYISPDRYLELKHFCLQYYDFKRRMAKLSATSPVKAHLVSERTSTHGSDQTGEMAANLAYLGHYTGIIDTCCQKAGGDISNWLFECVTKGKSYAVLCPPCSKQYFYLRYRAFFWMLDKVR